MNTIEFAVAGLSCGGCAKRMSTALQAVAGVQDVVVRDDLAQVTITGEQLQRNVLVQAIRDTGYQVLEANDIPLQGV